MRRVSTAPRQLKGLRRLGALAFVFFLVKGLFWLAVPAVLIVRGCGADTAQTGEMQP